MARAKPTKAPQNKASRPASTVAAELVRASRRLARATRTLAFGKPVFYTYAPLDYARELHERYLALARAPIDALFLGMNPGPFGMAQTGVPFGEVAAVRGFLGIDGRVRAPKVVHPKRPVEGLDCARSEVSGRRFWGLMSEEFGTREAFFRRAFVWNWCPLAFVSESGANITPDKLPARDREALAVECDRSLRDVVRLLSPRTVIGVGGFATERAREALPDSSVSFATILHPSPASPAANRGWQSAARRQLCSVGFFKAGTRLFRDSAPAPTISLRLGI
jgi:single-strand selective monofunctional uracil DNA glycosylase